MPLELRRNFKPGFTLSDFKNAVKTVVSWGRVAGYTRSYFAQLMPPIAICGTRFKIERMGHDLFSPPNVGGWAGVKNWLSTRTVVARANYASALVEGRLASFVWRRG